MSSERLRQMEELFNAVLERKPDERATFLAEACAGDAELLRQVQALIIANEDMVSFLNSPAYDGDGQIVADSVPLAAGTILDKRYRIVGLLGRGGIDVSDDQSGAGEPAAPEVQP